MTSIGKTHKKTKSGFIQTSTRYQAKNCSICPLNGICHKSAGNRIVGNYDLIEYRDTAYHLLNSEQGIKNERSDVAMLNLSCKHQTEPLVPPHYVQRQAKSGN